MSRTLSLLAGLGLTLALVCALSAALPADGRSFRMLLGAGGEWSVIQVGLWLLLGLGLGEAWFRRSEALYEVDARRWGLLPEEDGVLLGPDDMARLLAPCRNAPPGSHVAELTERCVLHFQSSASVAETHDLLMSITELRLHRSELDYSLLRYLIWLLPTVGFIGTVYGIADALAALQPSDGAQGAMQAALGPLSTAFYSTFVALVASATLMLIVQRVQRVEERALNDGTRYCLYNLINRLYLPGRR